MKRLIWLVILCLLVSFAAAAPAERLDDTTLMTFYDDSAFFGDSRMESFRRYIAGIRETDPTFLKKARIVCAGSISLYSASRNYLCGEFHFYYAGVEMTMYEAVKRFKPKRAFILLGLNDPVGIKVDKAIGWVEDIFRKMEEMGPDTAVYFLSETPVTIQYEIKRDREGYQLSLDEYNEKLKKTCEENGGFYIELAEALKDENNYLREECSSDNICHLSDEGNAVLIQVLKDYAQEQYDQGLWDPFAEEAETEGK